MGDNLKVCCVAYPLLSSFVSNFQFREGVQSRLPSGLKKVLGQRLTSLTIYTNGSICTRLLGIISQSVKGGLSDWSPQYWDQFEEPSPKSISE